MLIACGILAVREDRITVHPEILTLVTGQEASVVEVLLARIVETVAPPWLSSAVAGDEFRAEFVPDRDLQALSSTFSDPMAREAFLLALGNRFDATARSALGSAGEEFVVSLCKSTLAGKGRTDLAEQVRRVSLVSDMLGYDVVAPTTNADIARLEVKTMGYSGPDVDCYLSRNEAIVAARDPRWRLVACGLGPDGKLVLLGWCDNGAFAADLPQDRSPRARWTSARLRISRELLRADMDSLL
ncbi:MAG: hypothetical protein ACKVS8_08840 [Phycisphaerales bacterium]